MQTTIQLLFDISETNHSLSMILQQGIVPIMAYDECKSLEAYDKLLTPNMICAGYKDGGVDACKVIIKFFKS